MCSIDLILVTGRKGGKLMTSLGVFQVSRIPVKGDRVFNAADGTMRYKVVKVRHVLVAVDAVNKPALVYVRATR